MRTRRVDALRAEFTSAEDVDSFDVDGVADMDEDGVLLRRGRFTGGRSGGATEGEAEGVNSARRGSMEKRLLRTPLGVTAGIMLQSSYAMSLLFVDHGSR